MLNYCNKSENEHEIVLISRLPQALKITIIKADPRIQYDETEFSGVVRAPLLSKSHEYVEIQFNRIIDAYTNKAPLSMVPHSLKSADFYSMR